MQEHFKFLALIVVGIVLAFVANSYLGLEDKLAGSSTSSAS